MSIERVLIAGALALTLAAASLASASAAPKNTGGLSAAQQATVLKKIKPNVKGGGVKTGGSTVVELTVNECTKLGCTTQDDKGCIALVIGGNFTISNVHKRCVCSGGSQCITEASQ